MKIIQAQVIRQEKKVVTLHQLIHGTGVPYIWQEVDKISNISSENTKETSGNIIKFNWEPVYGKLEKRRI